MRATRTYCLVLIAFAAVGCARRPPPAPPPPTPAAPAAPSLELGGSVIRIADPKGRWRFVARSAKVKATGVDGPYDLTPADARYEEPGKEPVLMRAARADVNKQTQRVHLEGSVQISSGGWLLEAERVDYDLNTGKVVAPGRTKLTLGGEDRRKSPDVAGSGRGR